MSIINRDTKTFPGYPLSHRETPPPRGDDLSLLKSVPPPLMGPRAYERAISGISNLLAEGVPDSVQAALLPVIRGLLTDLGLHPVGIVELKFSDFDEDFSYRRLERGKLTRLPDALGHQIAQLRMAWFDEGRVNGDLMPQRLLGDDVRERLCEQIVEAQRRFDELGDAPQVRPHSSSPQSAPRTPLGPLEMERRRKSRKPALPSASISSSSSADVPAKEKAIPHPLVKQGMKEAWRALRITQRLSIAEICGLRFDSYSRGVPFLVTPEAKLPLKPSVALILDRYVDSIRRANLMLTLQGQREAPLFFTEAIEPLGAGVPLTASDEDRRLAEVRYVRFLQSISLQRDRPVDAERASDAPRGEPSPPRSFGRARSMLPRKEEASSVTAPVKGIESSEPRAVEQDTDALQTADRGTASDTGRTIDEASDATPPLATESVPLVTSSSDTLAAQPPVLDSSPAEGAAAEATALEVRVVTEPTVGVEAPAHLGAVELLRDASPSEIPAGNTEQPSKCEGLESGAEGAIPSSQIPRSSGEELIQQVASRPDAERVEVARAPTPRREPHKIRRNTVALTTSERVEQPRERTERKTPKRSATNHAPGTMDGGRGLESPRPATNMHQEAEKISRLFPQAPKMSPSFWTQVKIHLDAEVHGMKRSLRSLAEASAGRCRDKAEIIRVVDLFVSDLRALRQEIGRNEQSNDLGRASASGYSAPTVSSGPALILELFAGETIAVCARHLPENTEEIRNLRLTIDLEMQMLSVVATNRSISWDELTRVGIVKRALRTTAQFLDRFKATVSSAS